MEEQDSGREAASRAAHWPSALWPLESYAKLLTLIGVILYGALFYTYGRYFDELDARPEDVGITYLFVLARSIGLGLIFLFLIVAWTSIMRLTFMWWTTILPRHRRKLAATAVTFLALALAGWPLYVHDTLSGALLAIPITLIAIPMWQFSHVNPDMASESRSDPNEIRQPASKNGNTVVVHHQTPLWGIRQRPGLTAAAPGTISLGLVAVITLVGFTLGIKANNMAHAARHGDQVKPWRVLTFTNA
jgi:hypothetical protein